MILDKEEFIRYYNKSHYELLKDIFAESNLHMIEVFCPLEECRRRNLERGDRYESQSYEQNLIMKKNIYYDYRVDTYKNTSNECTESILQHLELE